MRSASSFTSISASQKEASACHSSSLRTPSPITPTRARRCSSQAGHTSTVCSTVPSGRLFHTNPVQEPPELAMSGEYLRHAEGEDAVRSIQPHLIEGTYRRDHGVPNYKLGTLYSD
ncbi:hypothetical protein PYW08_000638 [Mythimna loreyi]|uniref:Uncharacterized protein n=1 Tax=Mythimna loreyi TaxID=667449 RepID=A0ACC2RD06_9NEOP|nr:hypothetical protein PYW08_000638 [Mythimna loreyi]